MNRTHRARTPYWDDEAYAPGSPVQLCSRYQETMVAGGYQIATKGAASEDHRLRPAEEAAHGLAVPGQYT